MVDPPLTQPNFTPESTSESAFVKGTGGRIPATRAGNQATKAAPNNTRVIKLKINQVPSKIRALQPTLRSWKPVNSTQKLEHHVSENGICQKGRGDVS